MWSLRYLDPPDYILEDQETAYTSKKFNVSLEARGVRLEEALFKAASGIEADEQYDASLRIAFEKIRPDIDRETSDHDCLQLVVFVVNCTMSPEGLCSALLFFDALYGPAGKTLKPSQMRKAMSDDNEREDIEKQQARKKISFDLKHKHGPKLKELSAELQNLPADSPVREYGSSSKS